MGTPYLGEIRMFAGNFAPVGWMFCEGQTLPIDEFDNLFNLIGTTYGGDGQETFLLPDLRGRVPLHNTGGFSIGQTGGAETVTLTSQQIPIHNHAMVVSTAAGSLNSPAGSVPASSPSVTLYVEDDPDSNMAPQALAAAGGNQPHENFQPYLCVDFIIAVFGTYPQQG
jgi:microcystin-dependent protein